MQEESNWGESGERTEKGRGKIEKGVNVEKGRKDIAG
jgi:hypothetical protein